MQFDKRKLQKLLIGCGPNRWLLLICVMELSKLHINPLNSLHDWPIWSQKIHDFLDYHEGALEVIDGKLIKPVS